MHSNWSVNNQFSIFFFLTSSKDNTLYVGGYFTALNLTFASNIGKYNIISGAVSEIGSGTNSIVRTMSTMGKIILFLFIHIYSIKKGKQLFIGGSFTSGGGVGMSYVGKVDLITESWSALDTGVDNEVYCSAVCGN